MNRKMSWCDDGWGWRLADRHGKAKTGLEARLPLASLVADLVLVQPAAKLAARSIDSPSLCLTYRHTDLQSRRIVTNRLIASASGRSNGKPATGLYGIRLTCAWRAAKSRPSAFASAGRSLKPRSRTYSYVTWRPVCWKYASAAATTASSPIASLTGTRVFRNASVGAWSETAR